MPYATHWVCCKCGFGPMLIDNYPSCLNCQHRGAREACCTHAALGMEAAYVDEAFSCSSSPRTILSVGDELVQQSPIENLYSPAEQMMNSSPMVRGRATDLYICCSCGDGPKVYQHHARCVMCNHDACRYCTHVK